MANIPAAQSFLIWIGWAAIKESEVNRCGAKSMMILIFTVAIAGEKSIPMES
jgi:hypothetical protein